MPLPYFFVPHLNIEEQLVLPEETSKHCVQVLRMQQGEQLILTDGNGHLAKATILKADRKHCVVKKEKLHSAEPKTRHITIAISLLKNTGRFEWFLEKATEIGVSEIIPLICKRTEKQYFRKDRMEQIVLSAMLQSQQAWLPHLHEPANYRHVVDTATHSTRLIAHCEENSKHEISKLQFSENVVILIGPEGDFTAEEIKQAMEQKFLPVSLGHTRLRTETAGLFAASIIAAL
ncbi:16S rRNA (uracil(1498)-N(3))-methyltransferase [Panacibacter sp. DH6]|uniref:Ribosomal RNA small subunit methyltransferase E n=1 Tax=Panacibacter microcysteis TaxID=2793269 RepID=A0A931E645_9BACT|nr:RsmE family RNA methyltransferase [Panacibacter microcysteis]MBG9375965.1 16S rRNA (uracil(1498)-N(3))-methyltransferase [Panacibacter microcysteis]